MLSLPRVALLGLESVTTTVSSDSSIASSTMLAIVNISDVDPALMVRVPSARV